MLRQKRELRRHRHKNSSVRRKDYKTGGQKSFHSIKNDSNDDTTATEQSLNAFFNGLHNLELEKVNFDKTLIPRIKLKKINKSETPNEYCFHEMSSKSELTISFDKPFQQEENRTVSDVSKNNHDAHDSINLLKKEILLKPNENYFTKNFDECMKRLQQIEKEHEVVESEQSNKNLFYFCKESSGNEYRQTRRISQPKVKLHDMNYKINQTENEASKNECLKEDSKQHIQMVNTNNNENKENPKDVYTEKVCLDNSGKSITDQNGEATTDNCDLIFKWYANLKQIFEKKTENENEKLKKISCRITGATFKNPNEFSKKEEQVNNTRHYFSTLVKSNKCIIDEELPNPDLVKNIRSKFQDTFNKKDMNTKLRGSLQNIAIRNSLKKEPRPLSVQYLKNDMVKEIPKHAISEGRLSATNDTLETLKGYDKDFPHRILRNKIFEKQDTRNLKDNRNKKLFQTIWSDSGSVSSGISSDLSSYDTDFETFSKEGVEPEPFYTLTSSEEVQNEDKHYIQREILEKIRSFGTSITYYGGEMIKCSIGPILSPTAQAIMEEINERCGHPSNPSNSFFEFYQKYLEINEPLGKKLLSRTKVFGNCDMFQKPNELNNIEIEMYKNDLETEIGIRKPKGIFKNNLKINTIQQKNYKNETDMQERKGSSSVEIPTLKFESFNSSTDESGGVKILENPSTKEDNRIVIHDEILLEKENVILEQQKTVEQEINKPSNISSRETMKATDYSFQSKSIEKKTVTTEDGFIQTSNQVPNEILFGYEKRLLNQKRPSDMEFEEFEIGEAIAEKVEKSNESNFSLSHNKSEFSRTKRIVESERNRNCCPEVNNNMMESNDIHQIKSNENSENLVGLKFCRSISETPREGHNRISLTDKTEPIDNNNKYNKKIISKWPIETSVVMDIQKKNDEYPMKTFPRTKSASKTKIRLF